MVSVKVSRRALLFSGTALMVLCFPISASLAQQATLNPKQSALRDPSRPPTPGLVQPTDSQGAEQVVVTSRRRAEVLRTIPVAVDVLSHKQIQEQNIKSLSDIARLTPGLTFDQGISAADTRPAIRGFNIQLGRPSVAILIDGYDTTTEFIASGGGEVEVNLNLLDLERIEVVKGPQSALYGRNAFGGAINYVTAKPSSQPSAEVDTEVGDYGDYKVFDTFSDALNDKVSYRVSLETDGSNGYYNNTVTNKTLGGRDGQGGSTDFLIKPNADLTLRIYTEISHSVQQQLAAVNILPNGLLPNYDRAANPSPSLPEVVGTVSANQSQVNYTGNYPGSRTLTVRNFVSLDDDLDWATFSSRTGFQTLHNRLTQDTAYSATPEPAAIFGFENELQDFTSDTTQVSQDFRLTSPSASRLKWLGGFDLFYESDTLLDDTQYYLDHPSFFYPLARTALIQNNTINPFTDTYQRTYAASVYGSVGYEILPKLNATAEVRVAYDGVDVTKPIPSRTAVSFYNSGITYGSGGIPEGITSTSGSVTSRYINPKFELDYEIFPEINLYANASHGTKPAGFSLLNISGGTLAGQSYKQERVWEYELGAKSSLLNNRLQVSADVYFNDYRDQQVNFNDLVVNPPITGVTNAGIVYGLGEELEIAYRPIDPLSLIIGYSHIDEWFDNYISNVASDLEYVPNGDFKNKKVPDVPPNTITASARYEVPIAAWLNGFAQMNVLYESARFGNNYNTFKLGAFAEPNVQIGVENKRFSLLFFINNLLDDRTIRNGYVYVDLHNDFVPTELGYLPPPRTFGARLSYRF